MYFGLCYLHAVLDGRSQYGTLGWNKYNDFDSNDFDLSEQILNAIMKKEIKEPVERLLWLKYVFGKINFAGKIATFEDQRKL
jgi:dynein heavy chain